MAKKQPSDQPNRPTQSADQARSAQPAASPKATQLTRPTSRTVVRQPAAPPANEKKRGCGCCLAKLFALLLMLAMIAVITAFVWRFVTYNNLQTRLAEYGARGEIYGAEHLATLYTAKPDAAEATSLLSNACDDVTSSNFVNQSQALPYVGDGEIPKISETWEQLEEAKDLVAQYQRAADQLRQFGKLGGHAHFKIDFSIESGLDAQSIEMMGQGFNFLRLDSEIHMEEGNEELLAHNIRSAFVYCNAVIDIPSIDQYLRLEYDNLAMTLLLRSLARVEFSLESLNSFNDLLVERDYRDGLKRMLSGAKVYGNQFFIDPSGYYETQLKTQSVDELPEVVRNQQQAEAFLKYSPLAHEDHIAFLEAMDEYDGLVDQEWAEMGEAFAELAATHEARFSGQWAEYRYPFAPQLLPDFSGYAERVQVLNVRRQMIYGALTIKRYEVGEGRLPVHFVDVAPKYAPEPPLDPYANQPLNYRVHQDKGFTVYSVGPNGQDERGDNQDGADDLRISLPVYKFDGTTPPVIELDF